MNTHGHNLFFSPQRCGGHAPMAAEWRPVVGIIPKHAKIASGSKNGLFLCCRQQHRQESFINKILWLLKFDVSLYVVFDLLRPSQQNWALQTQRVCCLSWGALIHVFMQRLDPRKVNWKTSQQNRWRIFLLLNSKCRGETLKLKQILSKTLFITIKRKHYGVFYYRSKRGHINMHCYSAARL